MRFCAERRHFSRCRAGRRRRRPRRVPLAEMSLSVKGSDPGFWLVLVPRLVGETRRARPKLAPVEFHYCWEWRLRSGPERLWPLVSDTNRFNRDAGVPELELGEVRGAGRRLLRLRKLGIPIEWEEEPFEWIEPYRFSVVRRYSKGPVAEMRVAVELLPEDGGTLLRYEVWARPRNLLGRIAIPVEIGRRSKARFERAFRAY